MSKHWPLLRKRIYLALPAVQSLLVIYGVTSESVAALWISIVGILLTGQGYVMAAKYVDVSRETSLPERWIPNRSMEPVNVSRETLPEDPADGITVYPCSMMHGSAEPHVPDCEGWRNAVP